MGLLVILSLTIVAVVGVGTYQKRHGGRSEGQPLEQSPAQPGSTAQRSGDTSPSSPPTTNVKGWSNAQWGMSEEALLKAFPGEVVRLAARRDLKDGHYVS